MKSSFADDHASTTLTDENQQQDKDELDLDSGGKKQTNTEMEAKIESLTQDNENENENKLKLSKEMLDKIDTQTLESILDQRKKKAKNQGETTVEGALQENFNDALLKENLKLFSQDVNEMQEQKVENQEKFQSEIRPTLKSTESSADSKGAQTINAEKPKLQKLYPDKTAEDESLQSKPAVVEEKVSQLKQIKINNKLNQNLSDSDSQKQTISSGPGILMLTPSGAAKGDWKESNKDKYISLKIVGVGKPVSFKTDTSKDGSILLRLPGNVKILGAVEGGSNTTAPETKTKEPELSSLPDLNTLNYSQSVKHETPSILANNWAKTAAAFVNVINNNSNDIKGKNDDDVTLSLLAQQFLTNPDQWKILGKTGSEIVREQQKDENGSTHNTIVNIDTANDSNFNSNFNLPSTNIPSNSKTSNILASAAIARLLKLGSRPSSFQNTPNVQTGNNKIQSNQFASRNVENEPPQTTQQLLRTLMTEIESHRQTKQDFADGHSQTARNQFFPVTSQNVVTAPAKSLPHPLSFSIKAAPSYKGQGTMNAASTIEKASTDLTKKESAFEESELKMFDKGTCVFLLLFFLVLDNE